MEKIAVITPISHLNGIVDLLSTKGKVLLYEQSTKEQVRKMLLNTEANTILCNPNQQTYKIDKELLEGTKVSLINTCSTGMNHIDQSYCKENNIEVYSLTKDMELINDLPSTSELAFTLMSCLLRKIPESLEHTKKYGWDYLPYVGRQVKGLNVGIIGYGRLGKIMDKYCKAFEANTFICDPYSEAHTNSLEELFEICDVISIHVHVTEETKYMINKDLLGKSKKIPYIINTSRGEIVDEKAIVNALEDKIIAGYGTDVVEDEFGTITNSPIIQGMNRGLNIIVTPHTGGMTIEGQTKAYTWAINKL